MTAAHPILSRLETGRPLLLSADAASSLRARGVDLHGPAALGRLVRERPGVVREHYHQEILAGVDVICCLTADTIPRALQQIGMPFRSAALTGNAVELALEAAELAPRPVLVAGVLGNTDVPPLAEDRIDEELGVHASRLATAGCELLIARGFSSPEKRHTPQALARLARRSAVVSGAAMHIPTWLLSALDWGGFTADGMSADEVARRGFDDGAQVTLFEIESAEVGLGWIDRLLAVCVSSRRMGPAHPPTQTAAFHGVCHVGFTLAAGSLEPEAWGQEARRLLDAGVRVLGGGVGTTHRHLAALSGSLRGNERQSLWPRAV